MWIAVVRDRITEAQLLCIETMIVFHGLASVRRRNEFEGGVLVLYGFRNKVWRSPGRHFEPT